MREMIFDESSPFARFDLKGKEITPEMEEQLSAIQQAELSKRREAGATEYAQALKTVVISVDCANKNTERADYTAIGVWYETYEGRHFLVDVIRDKLEFPDLVKAIESTARDHSADLIIVEDAGAGVQYIQTRAGKAPCPIIPVPTNSKSKEFRFDGCIPLIEGGLVFLPKNATWLLEYEAEIAAFPNGDNDDQVDMTSQYLSRHKLSFQRGTRKLSVYAQPGAKPMKRPALLDKHAPHAAGDLDAIKNMKPENRSRIGG